MGITAANVTFKGNSLYCIKGLAFTPVSVSATPELGNNDNTHQVGVTVGDNGNLGCMDDATQLIVSTHDDAGNDNRFPVVIQVY